MAWNSNQYLKFENERTQPCVDLITRLDGSYNRILDLGCGPGNSTLQLRNAFGNAEITGFEADSNMIKKARTDYPDIKFVHGFAPDDLDKLDGKFDLVFSNACIHWIKEQKKLIDSISDVIDIKGTLAVQVPLTEESVFYQILYKLIEKKWGKLKFIQNFYNLNYMEYYNLLIKKFKSVSIWKTDYYHIVDEKMIIEWYKGSGLRPYLEALNQSEQDEFIYDLQERISENYKPADNGKYFLIMPRLFFIASR